MPVTREELEKEVREHGDTIFVRAQVAGSWANVPISQLNEDQKEFFISLWFRKGIKPIRIKDPDKEQK